MAELSSGTVKALEEAEESSDRSRKVLLVTLVTSVLVAMAAWNSRLDGWAVRRLEVGHQREQDAYLAARLAAGVPLPPAVRQAAVDADAQQRLIAEKIRFVSAPVLGFGFDINDLALVGGLAFVLLLVWFHFTMGREWLNVDELFRRARADGALRDAYDLLSMTQVLTIPPHPNGHLGSRWDQSTRILFWVPCLTQAGVVVHDLITAARANALSAVLTAATTVAGIVCLILMLRLTTLCSTYSKRIRALWGKAFEEAHVRPQYFATVVERDAEGAISALANPQALWTMRVEEVLEKIQQNSAAFFYVDEKTGARLLLQPPNGANKKLLVGCVPGLVSAISLP